MFRKGALWCSLLSAICTAVLLFCIDPIALSRRPLYLFFLFFGIFFMNFLVIFQYFYNSIYKSKDPDFDKYSIGIGISGLGMFTALYKLINNLVNNGSYLATYFIIAFIAFLAFSNLSMRHGKKKSP